MFEGQTILKQIQSVFECEPRIDLHRYPIHVSCRDSTVILEGEVGNIAAKKLALKLAAAVEGVHSLVDKLHVIPTERKGDGAIRDTVCNFLLGEPVLQNCGLKALSKGRAETLREVTGDPSGAIEISVADGVVALAGRVISLSHKRLAGVLVWWVPGCRDVVNRLEVVPPEQDNDDEIGDALRLALEKDPLVHADQIRASVRNRVVTLEGYVVTKEEMKMAEWDAWYLFGVEEVVNSIEVQK